MPRTYYYKLRGAIHAEASANQTKCGLALPSGAYELTREDPTCERCNPITLPARLTWTAQDPTKSRVIVVARQDTGHYWTTILVRETAGGFTYSIFAEMLTTTGDLSGQTRYEKASIVFPTLKSAKAAAEGAFRFRIAGVPAHAVYDDFADDELGA